MDRARPHLSPQALDEASDWFVEFSEGAPDTAMHEQFDAWLRRSPEHVEAYLRIAALWEESPAIGKARALPSDDLVRRVLAVGNVVLLKPAPTQSLETPEERGPLDPPAHRSLSKAPRSATGRSRMHRGSALLLVAASLLVTVSATWLYMQRDTYSTAVGEQRSVRLEDGSIMDLNSHSNIRVRFGRHQRNVELLEGQALFHVAKDSSRPFVVSTDETHVRAVGTEFDVYRKNGSTIVTVLEGRVAVTSGVAPARTLGADVAIPPDAGKKRAVPPAVRQLSHLASTVGSASLEASHALTAENGETLITAGEQVIVTPRAVAEPQAADVALATAWTQRKIVFKGSSLSEVVEEFNRYNTRQLVIADRELGATRISGVFSSTDPDSLLRFLRALPNIVVEDHGGEYRISRK